MENTVPHARAEILRFCPINSSSFLGEGYRRELTTAWERRTMFCTDPPCIPSHFREVADVLSLPIEFAEAGWVHLDRIVGGHRHHCDSDRAFGAGGPESTGCRRSGAMHQ